MVKVVSLSNPWLPTAELMSLVQGVERLSAESPSALVHRTFALVASAKQAEFRA